MNNKNKKLSFKKHYFIFNFVKKNLLKFWSIYYSEIWSIVKLYPNCQYFTFYRHFITGIFILKTASSLVTCFWLINSTDKVSELPVYEFHFGFILSAWPNVKLFQNYYMYFCIANLFIFGASINAYLYGCPPTTYIWLLIYDVVVINRDYVLEQFENQLKTIQISLNRKKESLNEKVKKYYQLVKYSQHNVKLSKKLKYFPNISSKTRFKVAFIILILDFCLMLGFITIRKNKIKIYLKCV